MTPSADNKRPRRAPAERRRSVKAGAPASQRQPPAQTARPSAPGGEAGVLSNLPSTRPQRPSARRAAAKRAASLAGSTAVVSPDDKQAKRSRTKRTAKPATTKPTRAARALATTKPTTKPTQAPATTKQGTKPSPKPAKAKRAGRQVPPQSSSARRNAAPPSTPPEPAVPPQGFETESDIAPGIPVEPPSRPELAASVAELLGELAQSGLATGGRLLRDALGRLPGV